MNNRENKNKERENKDDFFFKIEGKVIKKEKGRKFLISCDNGNEIIAEVCARFRAEGRRKIKIVTGERVVIEVPVADINKGQIVGIAKK
jgi:translation initiation factor IF-1